MTAGEVFTFNDRRHFGIESYESLKAQLRAFGQFPDVVPAGCFPYHVWFQGLLEHFSRRRRSDRVNDCQIG